MRLFRRGPDQPAPTDFWSWWAEARDRIAAALDANTVDEHLAAEINRAVGTIHQPMAWELGPGTSARHQFCLSPEGRPDLRQLALRWLASAPPADDTWEYHASRQPKAEPLSLDVAGLRFDLANVRAISSWDETRRRLDLRLWHPHFDRVPEQVRLQVGFLFLDGLLGEDDVERWIGQIELLEAPIGGRTPDELRAELERRKAEPGDADDTWVLAQGESAEGPLFVVADAALKRIDHPFADQHVAVGVVLEDGLPDDALAAELDTEEDDLVARFAGIATYAGRTTTPQLRTMHFVTEDLDRVRQAIDAWAETLPPRRIKVTFQEDMEWSFQQELGVR